MTPPDLRGCPKHGLADWVSYRSTRFGQRWYCSACRRARDSKSHYNGERCVKRGHLKTPWTWRHYGQGWRCLKCQYITAKAKENRAKPTGGTEGDLG